MGCQVIVISNKRPLGLIAPHLKLAFWPQKIDQKLNLSQFEYC